MAMTPSLLNLPCQADAPPSTSESLEALRESEQRYRLLFEHNPQPMWMHDAETLQFVAVNDAAVRRFGYSREEFLGMTVPDIRPGERVQEIMPNVPPPDGPAGPVPHRHKNGSVLWVEVTTHPVFTPSEKLTFVLAQDVTKQKGLEEDPRRKTQHDPLPVVPDQSLVEQFEQAKDIARKRNQKLAILAVEFDGLKQINETFENGVGDDFLNTSLKRMKLALRASDTVARAHGDEFAIIAGPVAGPAECRGIAERMLSVQRAAMKMDELELPSTISVGLAIYPEDGDSLHDLLRRAEYGLNQAKQSGRDCCRRCSIQEFVGNQAAV
jgi:diguanylate cyclase (GGDEF)-like protein/PAS domain S-box-containing protein